MLYEEKLRRQEKIPENYKIVEAKGFEIRTNNPYVDIEAYFYNVLNEKDEKEDEGVILSLVVNMYNRGCDYLVVLDAGNMSEIARAEFGHMQIAAWLQPTFFPEL